jgi:hypothetical protein
VTQVSRGKETTKLVPFGGLDVDDHHRVGPLALIVLALPNACACCWFWTTRAVGADDQEFAATLVFGCCSTSGLMWSWDVVERLRRTGCRC